MYDTQDVIILNALDKDVHAVAFGNHFTLRAGQLKTFRGEIGQFLDSNKGYLGLIAVSDRFADPEYKNTEEGKAELEQRRMEGINRRVQHLQTVVNNLQISVRKDLDSKNIKAGVEVMATDGELSAMDELLVYQRQQKDKGKERSEAARVRLRQISAAQNAFVQNQSPKKEE